MAVRFALLGCGAIARKHAEAISKHVDGAEIVAFCDHQKAKAKGFADEYGVHAFGGLAEMMASIGESIDVVSVLTPSGFHCENVIEIAGYGKHAVVEKPMALGVLNAQRMLNACNAAGIELFVVKQNRFNRPVQHLRRALDQGRFGELVMVTARVRWCRDEAYYGRDAWRGTTSLDGGVLENQASHHLDLIQWIGGPVLSVSCAKTRRLAPIEAEDTAIATLTFESGALGVIEATTATRPRDLEGSISVLGTGGSVEIGGFAANKIKIWEFVEPRSEDDDIRTLYGSNPDGQPFYAHSQYLQQVVNKLTHKEASVVSGEEGFKTVQLLESMQLSHESRVPSDLGALSIIRSGVERGADMMSAAG